MSEEICSIKIVPEISCADEAVEISVCGLQKNQEVLIRAISKDYYCINAGMSEQGQNSIWESYGVFIADDKGNLQLNNTAPIEGTYNTCNSMGLFYSMRIKELHKSKPASKLNQVMENRSYTIVFTVEVNNRIIASKEHIRIFCDESIRSETINNNNLVARYFTSGSTQKRPAVIVVSGSDGRIEKAQTISQLFASKGYSALAVCYFGLEGTRNHLDRVPLEIIENAIKWLKIQDSVDPNKIAIYGRSKGGELVLLAASMFSDISCVIANTPSCYVYEGVKNGIPSRHSSWAYQNREIPYLKISSFVLLQMLVKKIFGHKELLTWMYNKVITSENTGCASISVERVNGSILLFSSVSDAIWPSLLHCQTAVKRLEEKNYKYPVYHWTYDKAGHMLTLPYQSISSLNKCNGNLEAWQSACVDSWNKTVEFLNNWSNV
ncbi:acyl-CoA thioesterase/bile acid-CoA:amino acid N-acyltransferase family protein [Anaerocolumna sp. MB42-C2]|uniref:acyl-CoA thioesterase/bile acid-CoA:amino acid N-acyltransferase family protein n=1 Tax=Anaerocolumna sp. MB42-C2 TaxID=3070997 RepID=UPI0027E194F6|nr:acyl-CoA thioester hydrolase/BAAT C-terminal domain-containing protein [Anaerocolumna sp. MB42-C2]WMJ86934.1 acyl-CoA thioester hydrolase/BAAT C-terminal domain-containing protein [Anaerocolumna sp. MB42-C2]